MLNLSLDNGFPEKFQYLKFIIILGLTIYMILIRKNFQFSFWFILFTILLLDDAFSWHEKVGAQIAYILNYKSILGLRAVDFGEFTYVVIAGILLFICLSYSYRIGNFKYRKMSIDIVILFLPFLFFGVVMDLVHVLVSENNLLSSTFGILEDGGEMIFLSIITWYFFFKTICVYNHK